MKQRLLFVLVAILFSLGISAQAVAYPPIDLSQCGNEVFDLTVETPLVLGNQDPEAFTVTYHLTQADAVQGNVSIANPSGFVAQPQQTIFVRVTNTDNSGYAVAAFQVNWSMPVMLSPIPAVHACDAYTLPAFTAITSADAMYYQLPDQQGEPMWPGMVITNTTMVYVHATNGICSADESFMVIITPTPVLPGLPSVSACGSYTLPPIEVGHYFADPEFNIPLPFGTVITQSQMIYVRSVNVNSPVSCTAQGAFYVDINTALDFSFNTSGSLSCGESPATVTIQAVSSQQDLTYTWSPGVISTNDPATVLVTTPGVYTCTVTNGCGQMATAAITIGEALSVTALETVPPVTICNTGASIYTVNFSDTTSIILNNNTPVNFSDDLPANTIITYFSSEADANSNTNPFGNVLDLPASESGKIVYARIQSGSVSCFVVRSFALNIIAAPVIAAVPAAMTTCATSLTESPPRGAFDLTEIKATVLGSQDPVYYTIGFYATQASAEAGGASLATSSADMLLSVSRTLFVRLQNSSDAGCYVVTSVQLTVLPLPPVDILPDVVVCGCYTLPALNNAGSGYYSGPNGIASLAVGSQICTNQTVYLYNNNGVCSGQDSFKVTIADVAAITPPSGTYCSFYTLPELPYGNYFLQPGGMAPGNVPFSGTITTPGTHTVYVHFEDTTVVPSCAQEQSFTVTIIPFPISDGASEMVSCMENGTATFDLTTLTAQLLNGASPSEYEVLFYENENNALNNIAPVGGNLSAYTINSPTAVIYVRITLLTTSMTCWIVSPVYLNGQPCSGNTISGTIRFDSDNNGCSPDDLPAAGIQVACIHNNSIMYTYTNNDGHYTFVNAYEGANTISIAYGLSNTYEQVFPEAPGSYSVTLAGTENTITDKNFCIRAVTQVTDAITYFYSNTTARPGFPVSYTLYVYNNGTVNLSGNASLNFDTSKLDFVSAYPGTTSQISNTLNFYIDNLEPMAYKVYALNFMVKLPPAVNLGDILSFDANMDTVAPDNYVGDNVALLNQMVVNSYDPNDIAVQQGAAIIQSQVSDYLNYTIHFQNTGNADAVNVRITAALDSRLDWESFRPVGSSHDFMTERIGNEVAFSFNNINLPGSIQDEAGSNGYVTFKVKPKATMAVGDIISADANIYFDFNAAIATNIVTTELVSLMNVDNPDFSNLEMAPNPASDKVNISFNENLANGATVSLYDIRGKLVLQHVSQNNSATSVDVSKLSRGMYFVKITAEGQVAVRKLMVR